jgi:hypothetical protein
MRAFNEFCAYFAISIQLTSFTLLLHKHPGHAFVCICFLCAFIIEAYKLATEE